MPYSTQKKTILEHLRQFGSISSWIAIERYHITRLGAHIDVLRNDEGYPITDEWKTDGRKHWKEYHLEEVRQEYKIEPSGQMSIL